MDKHTPRLNPPKATLHAGRALFYLLLKTFLWTAVLLACGLYYANESLRPAPVKPAAAAAARAKKTPRTPALKEPPKAPPPQGPEMADPLSLITAPKAGANTYEKKGARAQTAARTRLKAVTFGGSGGNFVPLGQEEQERAPGRTKSAPRDQDAVLLPASAMLRSVKVKGARPVPAAAGKKYSGVDPEAEFLRERMRRQAAAAEEAKLQLRNEKLLLSFWLALLALAAMLIPSRVIKAWRLIHRPEGSHWTLK